MNERQFLREPEGSTIGGNVSDPSQSVAQLLQVSTSPCWSRAIVLTPGKPTLGTSVVAAIRCYQERLK